MAEAQNKDISPEEDIILPEDRLEGRDTVEGRLATWFEHSEWPLRLTQIKAKGYGITSSRNLPANQVVMSCPPYVFVPYETRKRNVCAYCFKMFKPDPENVDKSQDIGASPKPLPPTPSEAGNPSSENDIPKSENQQESSLASLKDLIKAQNVEQETPSAGVPTEKKTSDEQINSVENSVPVDLSHQQDTNSETPAPAKVSEIPSAVNDDSPLNESEPRCCPFCTEIWYCCETCQISDMEEHYNYECLALQNLDVEWTKDYYQYCDDLITDVRLLIRALNKRQISIDIQSENEDLDNFTAEYGHLISNKECYSADVLLSLRGVVQLVNYLMPDEAQMDEDELLDIYCKHRVNMFGIWGDAGECLGYGVYPKASFFNHSCWPNVTFYKNKEKLSPHLDFLTVYAIPKNSEVCISYIDISEGLKPRRHTLKDKYFFHCECDRCMYQELNPNSPDPYYDP
eukprot:TRINITY_DN1285_c0_g1_i1.p1 TRINITY_DN1285_c0_g1~~TRINITY_DN1285_c0_g1_i1.p1  ORF type:complete len:457 (+),score=77.94 TRINITY_DN1285_c0_g1_i1:83-1453(+)